MSLDHLRGRIRDANRNEALATFKEQVDIKRYGTFVRDPSAETKILKDWSIAYLYCKDVLRAPWAEFKAAMEKTHPTGCASDARAAYNYANFIEKSPIEGLEKHVAHNGEAALDYAKNVLGRPWSESDAEFEVATDAIMSHPTARQAYQTEMSQNPSFSYGA